MTEAEAEKRIRRLEIAVERLCDILKRTCDPSVTRTDYELIRQYLLGWLETSAPQSGWPEGGGK